MDALPTQEESGVEFTSAAEGVMHACGHDGHTAMLLAVARLLADRRGDLAGEVRFLFQHAEELPPGGAVELVDAGATDGVDAVFGCHLLSTLECGRVAALDGGCTAAADTFSITIRGRGGHAAFPEETVDPVATAAQVVTALQHVVSRESSAHDRVVVSVTRLAAGKADNVIPDRAEMGGTARTFTPQARDRARAAIGRIAEGVAAAHRATCEVSYLTGYDPVVNSPGLAALVRDVAAERLIETEPVMAGEDFSAYLRAAPGCFFFVGAGDGDAFPHHHPRFVIDERALGVGVQTFADVAVRFLS